MFELRLKHKVLKFLKSQPRSAKISQETTKLNPQRQAVKASATNQTGVPHKRLALALQKNKSFAVASSLEHGLAGNVSRYLPRFQVPSVFKWKLHNVAAPQLEC